MKPKDYIKIGIVAARLGADPDTKVLFVNRGDRIKRMYKTGEYRQIAFDETELKRWRDDKLDFWIGFSVACNELYIGIPE